MCATASITGDPCGSEYYGYLSVDALVQGLKVVGTNTTQSSFINTIAHDEQLPGSGTLGRHGSSWVLADRHQFPNRCLWITQYQGSSFHLISGP